MQSLAYFVAFLTIYFGWIALVRRLLVVVPSSQLEAMGRSMVMNVLVPLFVVALIWSLTRRFEITALLWLVLTYVIAGIVTEVVRASVIDWKRDMAANQWLMTVVAADHPIVFAAIFVWSLVASLLFPVITVVLYVVLDGPSPVFSLWAVRLILLMIIGTGMLWAAVAGALTLSSDTVEPAVRESQLLRHGLGLIPTSILLAVLVRLSSDRTALWPGAVAIAAYALAAVLVPYLIGRRRADGLQTSLVNRRRSLLVEIKRTVAHPASADDLAAALMVHAGHVLADARQMTESTEVRIAVAAASGGTDRLESMLASEQSPLGRPALRHSVTAGQQRQRVGNLGDFLDQMGTPPIRYEFLLFLNRDLHIVASMLRALGRDPDLAHLPGDPLDALSELESGAGSSSTSTDQPDPLASTTSTSDGALRSMDLHSAFGPSLDLELSEMDRRQNELDRRRPRTLVSASVGALATVVLAVVADSTASLVVERAQAILLH